MPFFFKNESVPDTRHARKKTKGKYSEELTNAYYVKIKAENAFQFLNQVNALDNAVKYTFFPTKPRNFLAFFSI